MNRILYIFLLSLLAFNQTQACFILCVRNDSSMLIGNHEDWYAKDAAIRIIPPQNGSFGSVIFTFESEGWAQGGMNEKGLFFDGALTPYQELIFEPGLEEYTGYIWQYILNNCATVEEALDILRKYKLPELEQVHIVLADARGNAIILGMNNGQIAIKRLDGSYLMQTNFNPWQPELSDEPVCQRYSKVVEILQDINGRGSKNDMLEILKRTHQDTLTVYSNIYDLKNKKIFTYYNRDFDHPIEVSIPDVFNFGKCMVLLSSIENIESDLSNCADHKADYQLSGRVINSENKEPIAFANIGILDKDIGTLSDPDGSFNLSMPAKLKDDSLTFSCIGYETLKLKVNDYEDVIISLDQESILLNEVEVRSRKAMLIDRLGWMGGRDGVLPFDTLGGGAVAALLLETKNVPFLVKKIQVRLQYNSKDTLRFRLHFYSYDSIKDEPGKELLKKEVILSEYKRFGWLRFDLLEHNITINERKFFVGLEWINTQSTRNELLTSLRDWEDWKREQYEMGNSNVELLPATDDLVDRYKYHGNMMNWPGFNDLPPWTALMIESGKNEKTRHLRTFERKTSFGEWRELDATLNVVVVINY